MCTACLITYELLQFSHVMHIHSMYDIMYTVCNTLIHAEPSTTSGQKGNPQGQLVFRARIILSYYHSN